MKKQICNGLLMIGIALMLQGCGQVEEPKESDVEQSVSENLVEEMANNVSDDPNSMIGDNYFFWRGLEGKLGGSLIIKDVEEKNDCIILKVGDSHKKNVSEEIMISQVDVLPGEEAEWLMTNRTARRQLYRCDYEDSPAYYFYTCPYINEYYEFLVCDGNAYYYIDAKNLGYWGEDMLIHLGEKEHITYICDFFNIKESDDSGMKFQIKRAGENVSGMFVQNGSESEFCFEGTIRKTEGIIEHDNEGKKQHGYLICLQVFLNGVEIQEIEEFSSWVVFSEDYLDYVYIEDFNFDGFMDIGVPIIQVSRTDVAMNYYIYDPDEEIFIRVPIADEKGIALPWDEQKSFDGRCYMMSIAHEAEDAGIYTLWQWNEFEIEKFAEVEYSYEDNSEEQWEAVVTGYDQNGNKTGKWNFSHDRSSWDDVWKKAEEEMHIQISNVSIGKTIYLNFENGDADYLETLLESENANDPNNKVKLLDKEAVEELIQYMRDNHFKIVSGEYKIPQTSNYEELISILKFEIENDT